MAAKKDFVVKVMPDEVIHTSISKSKNGYNSARVVVKRGETEYMSINYEWEGDSVPSFAMDLMGFMQANEMPFGAVIKGQEMAFEKYIDRAFEKKEETDVEEDDMEDD